MSSKTHIHKSTKRNLWLFYCINFISNFWFFTPIVALYFNEKTGSATAALSIFSIVAITTSIFEIPTGILGDKISKRSVLLLSAIFALIPTILYAYGSNYYYLIIAAICAGFGNALSSGTGEALLYETLQDLNLENEYKKLSGIYNTAFSLSIGLASIIGGYLATISLRLPFIVSICTGVVYVVISYFLVEPSHRKSQPRIKNNWYVHTMESVRYLLFHRAQFCLMCLSVIGWAICIQTMFKSISLLYASNGVALFYFGLFQAITSVASIIGMLMSHTISKKISDSTSLIGIGILFVLLWCAATIVEGVYIVIPIAIIQFLFGIQMPIINHAMHVYMPDNKRATILSIRNSISAVCVTVFTALFGYTIDIYGTPVAFRYFAYILILYSVCALFLPRTQKVNL